jgi:nitrate reductase NapA
MSRRQYIKAHAAGVAASVAGVSLPAAAANIVTESEKTRLTWSKAPCRFCGTGCSVMVAAA